MRALIRFLDVGIHLLNLFVNLSDSIPLNLGYMTVPKWISSTIRYRMGNLTDLVTIRIAIFHYVEIDYLTPINRIISKIIVS